MGGYRIFGDSISGNCLKVKWTAAHLGLDVEWIETSVLKGESRKPGFLALNPQGQVPLLVTPERDALAQSNAIIFYLNHRHEGGLLPDDPLPRARVLEWMFWEQNNHEPYVAGRRFQKTYLKKPDSDIDPKMLARGNDALALMEERLSTRDWIAGGVFSLADIALVAYTREADEGGFDLAPLKATRAWIARVEKRLGLDPVTR